MSVTVESLTWQCSCGETFEITPRRLRDIQTGRRPAGLCPNCRSRRVVVTETNRNFWRSRFAIEEIVALAEGIWGERDTWPERRGLPTPPSERIAA